MLPGETTGIDIFEGFKYDTKPEEIFDALGLPFSTTGSFGVKEYRYLIGEEYDTITIKYGSAEGIIDFDPSLYIDYSEEIIYELWAAGERNIDRDLYKMNKRFNIDESELSFIDEEANSDKLQQVLGAPHYYIETYDVNIEGVHGNVFVYELVNKSIFKVVYFRLGFILRAWLEDEHGNEIKHFIDRDTSSFFGDEL